MMSLHPIVQCRRNTVLVCGWPSAIKQPGMKCFSILLDGDRVFQYQKFILRPLQYKNKSALGENISQSDKGHWDPKSCFRGNSPRFCSKKYCRERAIYTHTDPTPSHFTLNTVWGHHVSTLPQEILLILCLLADFLPAQFSLWKMFLL